MAVFADDLRLHGSQIGLRQALPFLAGGSLEYACVVVMCFVSLAGALRPQPGLVGPAKPLSALILGWFAWKTASSGAVTAMRPVSRGALLVEGCTLQAVNPKASAAGIALATSAIDSVASSAMVGVEPVRDAGIVGAVVFFRDFRGAFGLGGQRPGSQSVSGR